MAAPPGDEALTSVSITTQPTYSGKVRDLYDLPDGRLLLVASDRISAYDVVLPTPIPDKGRVLTAMSLWWFDQLADLIPNHVISTEVPTVDGLPDGLAGRSIVCERLEMIAVECVARGYLTGSGLAEYEQHGSVCGIQLPAGLVDGSRLPEPIFTPAAKASGGEHDRNVSFEDVVLQVGPQLATRLREITLQVYQRAEAVARERGVLLADTKLELGLRATGELVLADEVLTPDSSRFWPADQWAPGGPQPSFDKQYVRDWLNSPESGWDRYSDDPPPLLPDEIVERTRARYIEAYERVTGRRFDDDGGGPGRVPA